MFSLPGFKSPAPSTTAHVAWNEDPGASQSPSSKCHPVCQHPCSTMAPRMKCNAPDVVGPLPSTEGHAMISPLLGSVLPLISSKIALAVLAASPHCWLTLHFAC